MVQRLFHRLAILLLLAGLVTSSAAEPAAVQASHDDARHDRGSPCADPGPSGDPCGPGCACACCPGHLTSLALVAPLPSLRAPRTAAHALPGVDEPRIDDFASCIFRPPRA